jgi:hypothetical protein
MCFRVVRSAVVTADVIEGVNVRMRQRSDGFGFPVEAVAELRISGERRRKDLDRDRPIDPRVLGFVDLAHATDTDQHEDFVRAEPRAGN